MQLIAGNRKKKTKYGVLCIQDSMLKNLRRINKIRANVLGKESDLAAMRVANNTDLGVVLKNKSKKNQRKTSKIRQKC